MHRKGRIESIVFLGFLGFLAEMQCIGDIRVWSEQAVFPFQDFDLIFGLARRSTSFRADVEVFR